MKYFVTGATGFVGSHVVRQLVEAGHQVVAVVRNPAKAQELVGLGVRVFQGDVTDKESMREPMSGTDGVFHIAGWYKVGVKDKSAGEKINIQGTRNVLELMKELGIPKGVYTSTLAVNSDTHGKEVDEAYHFTGRHLSEYDRTKWVAHYEVADPMIAEGLPLVIVQPGLIYGLGDTSSVRTTFIQYLQHKLPMLPGGTAFSWAHVEDIARGHILAMEKGKVSESYIISGPTHTLVDAMHMAQQITGVPAPRVIVPPTMMKVLSAIMGVVEKVVAVPDDYSAEYLRTNSGITYIGNNAKARRELGYQPRPLKEGLTQTLEHEMELLGMK
ncbi:NAD-dependent epimerase/dehydratase family protein [Dictyobacter aurantiacus]|uniref:Dihydroflavonol-4-reductase n=1 Tax=Dictyobacter aurantiacus TaxID=1936993 RepID=A0A401ZSE3_9CHLR|nr:NAD-dependent epimerase/dehydratase family protein [Dictyobacter aurantiacus]GCE09797.1 dihydroflavonol-4-reductase [Dictyobacter aurantiacus]